VSALIPRCAVLASLLALAACHSAPPPAPPSPPALSRPLIALPGGSPVRVPSALLVEQGGVPGVFVLAADHTARFRMVRTGQDLAGRVEILAGLSGDETLVGGELRDVHDGSPITSAPSAK